MFKIDLTTKEANLACQAKEVKNNSKLWHHRLGHLGIDNMIKLRTEDIRIDHNISREFCKACALGKSTKLPHKTIPKDKESNDIIIHSDLMGPMRTESLGSRSKYVLTYLCSKTEYSYVYLLRSKSEQFEKLKEFKSMYELSTNRKIKEFRTDNGKEYMSSEFKDYLKEHGIKHNTSVAYCPQSNGKAERLNRTLIEKARCMLIAAKLRKNLWGAAITTANYLRNISPSSNLDGKSPYEVSFNKLPKINHLRIFGCEAYPLNLKDRGKFEAVAESNCIFIGYGEKEGIYWLLDQNKNKAFRSRDLKFNENSVFNELTHRQVQEEIIDEVEVGINTEEANEETEEDGEENEENEEINEDENEEENEEENEGENEGENEEGNEEENEEEEKEKDGEKEEENKEDGEDSENSEGGEAGEDSEGDETETKENENMPPRKSNRKTKPTQKYDAHKMYANVICQEEPQTYEAALDSPLNKKWKEAINSEINSLKENKTWIETELPVGKKTIKTKWIFKIKKNDKNEPYKYKARLVAKGYSQKEGIDYNETFAPVVKIVSLRLILALAINEDLKVHHIDVSTAFLHGDLDEDVYIEIPQGINELTGKNKVLKLKKALYGLRQASKQWNVKIVNTLTALRLKKLESDNCVFFDNDLIIAVYVDDMVIVSSNIDRIDKFKKEISEKFKCTDLGVVKNILGINVQFEDNKIFLNQKQYINTLIKKFNLEHAKEEEIPIQPNQNLTSDLSDEKENLRILADTNLYRQAIGSLIYLMTSTRPDISYTVGVLSRFMHEPRELHWRFLKRLLRYVKTTRDFSLVYTKNKEQNLVGYTDSDFGSNVEDRKSTAGYCFMYGNCLISWNSAKQKVVSLSSTEAEYIGLTTGVKELMWLRQLLKELNRRKKELVIHCDNKSTICLAKNPEFHARSKHIDIRHHFIRDLIKNKTFTIEHIRTENMVADVLTKGLPKIKHYKCLHGMMIDV